MLVPVEITALRQALRERREHDAGGSDDTGDPGDLRAETVREESTTGGQSLVCAACGQRITSTAARVEIDGRSEHTFVNPHCIVFRIATYAAAPGCRTASAPSTDWSWFAGYGWQIAICGGCATHLGWRFVDQAATFWGLIRERLVELEDDAPRP